ncbi:hypothetical protein GGI04_004028 [Coemansia thaxteri]|nr:hypothetical protein GGI04_004028 [Coemansia thaxteri]
MRLPFSAHRSTRSTDNFVQLPADTEPPRRAASPGVSSVRDRSLSGAAPYARGRPLSAVYAQSPPADMHVVQIEERLDTLMDAMGLSSEQRLAMKNMSPESKTQLIHTHKARANVTPLSEHLNILARAGTQSLPRARLEKLRVDIAYQSIIQLNSFIENGGLRLLLTHLTQLNERRSAGRRQDELLKERDILACILGLAKVPLGANFLLGSSAAHLRHILDSLGTAWLPCSVMPLQIVSYLIHYDGPRSSDVVAAALFRREAAAAASDNAGTARRSSPFVEWMQAIDRAVEDYVSPVSRFAAASVAVDQQKQASSAEFMAASIALINDILDSLLATSIDKRVRLYEKLHGHDILVKFARLRAWRSSVVGPHLRRWDEMLRRDYNIARSLPSDAIVLGAAGDSSIRDMSLFTSFIAHYQDAKAIVESGHGSEISDADDEILRMNLSTCKQPLDSPVVARSAPGSPGTHASRDSVLPSVPRSRSHSNVAETGSLRDLHASTSSAPNAESSQAALAGLKTAHSMLKRAFLDVPRLPGECSDQARRELQTIVDLAQAMLATFD